MSTHKINVAMYYDIITVMTTMTKTIQVGSAGEGDLTWHNK